jgi:type I restriction enzyme S subunit
MTKLSALPIPTPPVAEQERLIADFEDQLSLVDDFDKTVDASLARSSRLRQSILNYAFEGKLVPQDPNDEPGSLLLERIRATRTHTVARARAIR